jgi:hypothetical protein
MQIVIKFAQKSIAGISSERKTKINQDSVTAIPNLLPDRDSYFFAISDGHGKRFICMKCFLSYRLGTNGHHVSDFIKKNLPSNQKYMYTL